MYQVKNFYLWLLQVICLLGLLALCLWLALRPKEPTFTIIEFSVPEGGNQNLSAADDANQVGNLTYTLEISNSNKDSSIYYDEISLIFYFGKNTIGKSKISISKQYKRDRVQVMDDVDTSKKVHGDLAKAISKGKAELRVDLSTKIQYSTWGVKSRRQGINLHANIPVGPDGKISGKKKNIKLSKKRKLKAPRYL